MSGRRSIAAAAAVIGALALLGCDPEEPSDAGQYELQIELHDQLGVDGRRVLVGSRFEATLDLANIPDEGARMLGPGDYACIDPSASGSLSQTAANSYEVTSAGPGAIELAAPALACPESDLAALAADRWSMIGVAPEDVVGRWIPSVDGGALGWNMSPGPAASWPDAFGVPLREALVAEDGRFTLQPALLERDAGERAEVRWWDPEATLDVPGHYRELVTYVDEDGVERQTRELIGRMRAGESFASSLTVVGHEFALPRVEAVSSAQITELELVGVYWGSDSPTREWGPPAGVVAIARDGEGRRIVGAPIEWSVTRGRVSTSRAELDFGDDMQPIADCRAAPRSPQWRAATIEARLGELVATADLEWVALASDGTDPSDPDCVGSACSCSTDAAPSESALAMLGLAILGAGLRRRHSKRATAASTDST